VNVSKGIVDVTGKTSCNGKAHHDSHHQWEMKENQNFKSESHRRLRDSHKISKASKGNAAPRSQPEDSRQGGARKGGIG